MRRLHDATLKRLEDRRQELHLEDGIAHAINVDTVTDVVRVLDEQENDRGENLLRRSTDEPGETKDERTGAVARNGVSTAPHLRNEEPHSPGNHSLEAGVEETGQDQGTDDPPQSHYNTVEPA